MIELASFPDERGKLTVGEVGESIPFEVRRIFTVTGVPEGVVRGGHAHGRCHQLLVAVSGSLRVTIHDDDGEHVVHLADAQTALHLPPEVYSEQSQFSSDAVLLVLASEPYDLDDYLEGPPRS